LKPAIVFDVDGTLVTFKFDVVGTRKALFAEMQSSGFAVDGLSLTSPTQDVLDELKQQCEAGAGHVGFAEMRKKMFSLLDSFEAESSRLSEPFEEAIPALRALQPSARLAVLTNSGRKAASEVLSKSGMVPFFEFVLTRDDVDEMKPSPKGLQTALSRLSMPADHVFYVGDSLYDVRAAKGAGVQMVSVSTGNYTADRLRAEGADYVVGSVSELPALLGDIA
jgi:HAD superfamily hydrolase (TIGR01549 family)